MRGSAAALAGLLIFVSLGCLGFALIAVVNGSQGAMMFGLVLGFISSALAGNCVFRASDSDAL